MPIIENVLIVLRSWNWLFLSVAVSIDVPFLEIEAGRRNEK